jgi:hypothetical protein
VSSLPLLLDPIPAPQCGLVGAREPSPQAVNLHHLPHESCFADLARARDCLDEAARLAKAAGECRSLGANEGHGHPYNLLNTLSIFTQLAEQM